MYLFGIFHIAPHLWVKNPQNSQFWGVYRRFEAKIAKSKPVHVIASIPTKFCTVIKTTKCTSWVVPNRHYKSNIADGRHLGKISAAVRATDEIWLGDAVRPSWPFRPLKNLKFQKSNMAAVAILKNLKIAISRPRFDRFWPWKIENWHYLRRCLSDFDKIWHSDAVRLSWPFRSEKM